MSQVVILRGDAQRDLAKRLIDKAPADAVVKVSEARRTGEQNNLLWSRISDVARAKPDGRKHPAETWKQLFCHALGYSVQFEEGLNGQPFPTGFSTSRMTKAQLSDLIEFVTAWGAERGVRWSI